jgi:D-aminoacyl-tRNA deacylase
MRAVIQRISQAIVKVDPEVVGETSSGLLVFLGISKDDTEEDAAYLLDKVVNLRIFEDKEGKFNLSLLDLKGELMVISQFTLYGDARKGRRPSFSEAAKGEKAQELYDYFIYKAKDMGIAVAHGNFGEHMEVRLTNDGPVTILLDSGRLF